MIKVHRGTKVVITDRYRDDKIESVLSTGDKTFSFKWDTTREEIDVEDKIEEEHDNYVVKEVRKSTDGSVLVSCSLDVQELESVAFESITLYNATIISAARVLLDGTGWRVDTTTIAADLLTKSRNISMANVTAFDGLKKLCDVFMCEIRFDTKLKDVYYSQKFGKDVGMAVRKGVNLVKLDKKVSTYDLYTRIIPYGKNGMTIESVNQGRTYLENYQFSSKILPYIWKDESYDNPTALKEDAERKLLDISKPVVSYSASILDLSKLLWGNELEVLELGDTITIVDSVTETYDTVRIVKIVEYPHEPTKNTYELSSTTLTFEEMQAKVKAMNDLVKFTINEGGTVSVGSILNFNSRVVSTTPSVVSQFEPAIQVARESVRKINISANSTYVAEIDWPSAHPGALPIAIAGLQIQSADVVSNAWMINEDNTISVLLRNISSGAVSTTLYLSILYANQ